MHKFLEEQYGFSDFQIAQLKYVFKTITAEVSKFLIMAFLFREKIWLYLFTIALLLLLRTSTGGFHCKTYFSCFLFSTGYMYLCLEVLPMFTVNKFFQLLLLFACMLLNYYIGPVSSNLRPALDASHINKARNRALRIIFVYLTLTYILPESLYVSAGFWVVILHTVQLIVAKLLKKRKKESETNTANSEKCAHTAVSTQPAA